MNHLSVLPGGRVEFHDTPYFKRVAPVAHPVHLPRVEDAFAKPGEVAYAPRWALQVLSLAVDGNPKAIERAGDALEVLAAHLSKPAPNDDAPVHGIPRPGGVS